jgi:hypothetical protein
MSRVVMIVMSRKRVPRFTNFRLCSFMLKLEIDEWGLVEDTEDDDC